MRPGGAALRLAVSAGLVGALLWAADGAAALARLGTADPLWLIVAVALLSAQTVLMAARWWRTARALGVALSPGAALGEYYLAQIVNMTLPGGVVGDVARALRSQAAGGLARAAQAVMVERLAGQIAMLAVGAAALALSLARPGGIAWPAGTAPALAATLGGGGAALFALRIWAASRPEGALASFARAVRTALLSPGERGVQIALGAAIAALNLAAFAAAARATGTALGFEAALSLVPLILTAMVIPLGVGGWGWREGAAAALFPLAAATPEAGLAASLAFGAAILVASLPGALWPILARRRLPPDTACPSLGSKP